MFQNTKWLGIVGFALLAGVGCGYEGAEAEDGDDDAVSVDAVRISGRFEITIPAADVWAGTTDLNTNVAGTQVRVEVHQYFHLTNRWSNHGNERRTQYRIITTGEERVTGAPRTIASSNYNSYRAVNGAFVVDGKLYLVGNSTGGVLSGATRNEKPVVFGLRFNGATTVDSFSTKANIENIASFTFSPPIGPVVFATPSFSQVWSDTPDNEHFACYNVTNTSAQFLTGTSPTDFRSVEGGFVLDGTLYALGEATGGANSTGTPGAFTARAPRRALCSYGAGNAAVNYNVTVTNLPSP